MVKLWIFFVFLCHVTVFGSTDNSCLTPERTVGNCVDISKCSPLLNIIMKNLLSPADITYLRSTACGFNGNRPKVCCSQSNSTSETVASTSSNLLPNTTTCGSFSENRIIPGTEAQLGGYPWLALLQYDIGKEPQFHCGGVLINDRYVLTAAHCIQSDQYANWTLKSIRFGEHDVAKENDCEEFSSDFIICTDPPIDVAVEQIIVHYKFNKSKFQHDIALIRLAKNINFTEFISPICLETTSNIQYPNNWAYAIGWGADENDFITNKKSTNRMAFNDTKSCQKKYPEITNTSDGNICLSILKDGLSTVYYGDSGGPLQRKSEFQIYFAVGVMTFNRHIENSTENAPILYTKIKEYLPWILNNLNP